MNAVELEPQHLQNKPNLMKLRPEHQLMINLVSETYSREEILEFIFSETISWDFFLQELLRNSVGPLTWEIIQKLKLEEIFPPKVIQGIKSSHQQTSFQNFFLFEETKKVVEALSKKRIPAILFKGSSLSQIVYKNFALRPCSDVDMLVSKDSMGEVKKTFFESGFTFPKDLIDERFYYQNHFHIAFYKTLKNCSVNIEAHWNLMDKYLLGATNIHEIWERKRPLQFEGIQTNGLCLEHEVIYLALHILKHGYMNAFIASNPAHLLYLFNPAAENKLIWFVDIKKILETQNSSIDWPSLIETATRWGIIESIRPIFIILKTLFPSVNINGDFLRPDHPVKVSLPRKLLFKTLLTRSESSFIRKHLLTMKGDLQFRLIRVFDIIGYMFPNYSSLSRLYRIKVPPFALFYYPFHVTKTALLSGYGLSQWLFFSLWKTNRHADHGHHHH